MPWIPPEVYGALLRCAETDVVFPVFNGERGHPVLFNAKVKDEVLCADPGMGSMREIAERFPVAELPWTDDSVLRDVDTLHDLG
jgi:molybdenum cofactor cytidylyltransferase